jgi:hypothetical protein
MIHAAAVHDPQRIGTTLYVGGYPSLATQQAQRNLVALLADTVPVFHWSDIDPDGTRIFRTIERAIGRTLRARLMSPDIAEQLGKATPGRGAPIRCPPRESGIFDLAAYLEREDARILEQEERDPRLPV